MPDHPPQPEDPESEFPPECDEASDRAKPSPAPESTGWMVAAIILTLLFLVPAFMLMRPAAQPSARASHAASHGFMQLDNEEGALLYQARLFKDRRGHQVYHPLVNPPYVVGTYTPLFMAAVAAIDPFKPVSFSAGRTIVWCSALGIATLLVLMIAAVARNAPVGVLTAFLFLATWEVHRWIGYFRVDFPAIFLSLGGLAVIVLGNGRHAALALGSLLMILGLYTKQTVIAAPAACIIALLLHRSFRQAVVLALWMLAWGLPALLFLQFWTDQQFLRHIFSYNINTWHEFNLRVWSRHVWHMHRWFFLAGLVALPLGLFILAAKWRPHQETTEDELAAPSKVLLHFWQPMAWYALFSLWNFLAISKAGSAENYLLEPIAGWSLLIGITSGAALRTVAARGNIGIRLASATGAVAILALITLHAKVVTQPGAYEMRFSPLVHPIRPDFEAAELIRARMRQAKNPLSELAIYHLQLDQEPVIQPFIMSELSRQGKWDQEPFLKMVRAGAYDIVIALDDLTAAVPTDKYTPEMLAAFHTAYKLETTYSTPLWNYHILIPKDSNDMPATDEIAGL